MGGKATAEYYRAYRSAHPDYRARERLRKRLRRSRMTKQERDRERGVRKSRATTTFEIPPLHSGHDIFAEAKRIADLHPGFRDLTHPFYDDLVSEIVVALLEGRSGQEARQRFLRSEYDWRYRIHQPDGRGLGGVP